MVAPPAILLVLTSRDRVPGTAAPAGVWMGDLAAAWSVLAAAGACLVLTSPLGGAPPIEPAGDHRHRPSEALSRFMADREARDALADTLRLDQVDPGDFDAVLYPGGSGLLGDLIDDRLSLALIAAFAGAGKPMGFVSQGPAALLNAMAPSGAPFIAGRRLTAVTDREALADGMGRLPPPSLAARLIALGARCEQGPDGAPHVITDGALVTGQNTASAEAVAWALLTLAARAA